MKGRAEGRLSKTMGRSEEHTSELQSPCNLVCRLLLEKKSEYSLAHPVRDVYVLGDDHHGLVRNHPDQPFHSPPRAGEDLRVALSSYTPLTPSAPSASL